MDYILETLGKVGFDWRMGLFSLINFVLVFWILKKLFFKKIVDTINERQSTIQEGLDNFEKSKTELGMATLRSEEIIHTAKADANAILEKAHEQAKVQGEQMKTKAREEVESIVVQAKKNIEAQKQEMKEELHRETVSLVISVAEKILGEKMDDKKNDSYITDILKTLK
jgi:F-type H+-transporting ATPase subunit b